MKKLIYLLLFILDMIFTPIVIVASYIHYMIMLIYFCLKDDREFMDELINYNKWFVEHMSHTYINSIKEHKKRILGV